MSRLRPRERGKNIHLLSNKGDSFCILVLLKGTLLKILFNHEESLATWLSYAPPIGIIFVNDVCGFIAPTVNGNAMLYSPGVNSRNVQGSEKKGQHSAAVLKALYIDRNREFFRKISAWLIVDLYCMYWNVNSSWKLLKT